MQDIHGNELEVDDTVYIIDAARGGSNSKRLLLGRVDSISGNKAQVFVWKNARMYSKTSATIVKPAEDLLR